MRSLSRVLLLGLPLCLVTLGLVVGSATAATPPSPMSLGVATDVPTAVVDTPRRLLIAGDSITQGSSGDYTWRYRLWKKLATTAPGRVTFVGTKTQLYDNVNGRQGSPYYAVPFAGRAHSATWGALLYDEVDRVASEVASTGADTLVTMLGINDIVWQGASEADIKSMYRTYVERARAAAPGIDIVLCKVLSRYDFFGREYLQVDEARQVATAFTELAAEMNTSGERVVIADTLSGWDARLDTWDGTHPNPTGETLIAQRVSAALAKLGIGTASPSIYRTTKWKVRPAAPAVDAGAEEVTMAWNKLSTGATAMYLEYNLTNEKDGYQRLPYGIADQSSWHLAPLVAGGDYKFRTVPIKGFMTGVAGAASERTIAAKAFQRQAPSVNAAQSWHGFHGTWRSAENAQGYLLSFRTMGYRSPITYLPYPVDAGIHEWAVYPLPMGRYFKFRVVPVRGYVEGTWSSSTNVRTAGLASGRAYIALGDSYSSGLGAHRNVALYDLDVPCRRTTDAWAFQMQNHWNTATKLVACQGDKVDAGIDGGVQVQLRQIQPFFAQHPYAPQLVTVTVGGNDVGFSSKLKFCRARNCGPYEADWIDEIDAMNYHLRVFYDDLRDSAPNADIVVGGYPDVIDISGHKQDLVCSYISSYERRMFVRLVSRLNSVIDNAAEGVARIGRNQTPIWSAAPFINSRFAGHGACQYGSEEWIHSYTTGGGLVHKVGMNSFHPKPVGQTAYAYGFADALIQKAGRW
jgi:lysophospholipase L1-like esterase